MLIDDAAVATAPRPPRCVRAMVAVEDPLPADVCLDVTLSALTGPTRLTVATVPSRPHFVTIFAPAAGYELPDPVQLALQAASRSARRIAALVSGDVSVEHRAVRSWRHLLELASEESVDVLYVAGTPASFRDRKALRRAARRGGVRVVTICGRLPQTAS